MGYRYSINCDGCGKSEPGWNSAPEGWAVANIPHDATQWTYCPGCWTQMLRALRRLLSDEGK